VLILAGRGPRRRVRETVSHRRRRGARGRDRS
jgi:hypothetical protein